MGLLQEKDRLEIEKLFGELTNDVKLVMFTQDHECEYCKSVHDLLTELSELSGKLNLEVYDFVKDAEKVKQYQIDKIPALVVEGEKDYGIRFYGVPGGYEFASLIEDILDVSRRDPGLPPVILEGLAKIDKPVHLQAMVTLQCPHCPQAVRTAHRFAMASDFVRGDMIETSEFPHLAVKYNVRGVPNTIVNEDHSILGGVPEMEFLKETLKAIGQDL